MKTKQKILIQLGIIISASTAIIPTVIQLNKNDSLKNRWIYLSDINPTFKPSDKLQYDGLVQSSRDVNVKDKENEPKKVEEIKQVEPPKVIAPPTPTEEKPKPIEPEKPIVSKPVAPITKPEEPKNVAPVVPITQRKTTDTVKVQTDIGEIEVVVVPLPPRLETRDDKEAGITNRKQYLAELTPDLISNKVTDEHRKNSVTNATTALNDYTYKFFGRPGSDTQVLYIDYYIRDGRETTQAYLDNHPADLHNFLLLYDKFLRLIESGNAKQYMYEEAQKNYEQWYSMTDVLEYIAPNRGYGKEKLKVGWLWIAMNIDSTKFNKLSATVEKNLQKGLFIGKDNSNIYINEKGEIESYSFSPIFNKALAEYTRNNKYKRAFGNNEHWWRFSGDIESDNYKGWSKSVATEKYRSKYNLVKGDGIEIFEYTRKEDNPDDQQRQKGTVVSIDVSNREGYLKTLNLIKELNKNGEEITGYKIKNIGRTSSIQEMREILAALPDKLPLLELFFESLNTSSLIELEDKEIDELGLYTSLNSLLDEWSFNPWALKKTAWVNTMDYNVSSSYSKYDRIFTRITFDTLVFDKKDWVSEEDMVRINNGLRMAYFTRNNERIFQGGWGAGNKPDRETLGNSYPMGLDLSRIPEAKGLKNMIFWDKNIGKSAIRKLSRIILYNDSDIWETDTENMNLSQFSTVLDTGFRDPRSKITFSNGTTTKHIYIKSKVPGHKLSSEGLSNLNTLISFSDGTFNRSSTKIYVSPGENNLYNQLKNTGYNVEFKNSDDIVIL
ncbi:putative immunoglobulin-blocking virulence protein [Mycoplasma leonicaptivi]|uniref:putative immunoglobulin-blocking virulence protein n=1 Tax=Mycoplasma leonicaptivi TaxID=36742 RepID=UPI00047FEA0F|nr:putative immunoglobulin-blocking virulence protein [Mycoplasma leonicaptivi]